ncbi:MAG: transcriptional regulator PpsR [Hasllibacter sp.]
MNTPGGNRWRDTALPLLSPDQLAVVLAAAAEVALVAERNGLIGSVLADTDDPRFAPLSDWPGQNLRDTLTVESVPKLNAALDALAEGEDPAPAELNHRLRNGGELAVRYAFHRLGQGDGVLLVGRDLGPVADLQAQLVDAQIATERDYEERRAIEARYRMVLGQASDAILLVDEATARVVDLNPAAGILIGRARDAIEGAPLASIVSEPNLSAFLEGAEGEPVAAIMAGGREGEIRPARFRAGGRRLVLLRLSDGGAGPDRSARIPGLDGLWAAAPEGFALTDAKGTILDASEGFLELIDAATGSQARGRSLADFLRRGAVDLRVLTDGAQRTGAMRSFATGMKGATGREVPVEISATHLARGGDGPAFGFVIRDVSRLERGGPAVDEKAAASVAALVGNAPLREIVSDTTDVVEKMCIETAVDLTSNNRVAAAEMLGLSRQSLYVKLRKYGLLNKDG